MSKGKGTFQELVIHQVAKMLLLVTIAIIRPHPIMGICGKGIRNYSAE
jgi:hypothetical protein